MRLGQLQYHVAGLLCSVFLAALTPVTASGQLYLQNFTPPGAVQADGSFAHLMNMTTSTAVRRWDNVGTQWVASGITWYPALALSPPGDATPTGGFFVTMQESWIGRKPFLARWEPTGGAGSWSNYGAPPSLPSVLSGPSALMYGNRVMIVGGGELYERFLWGAKTWHPHGKAQNYKPLRNVTPCVLRDGSVFVTTQGGEVAQMWWDSAVNQWKWHNHGYPEKANAFGMGGVKAVSVGAPMPSTSKVFVTCDDGSLRQIFHDGSGWVWHDHGKPFGWRIDSTAVSISEGKLFVTGSWNSGSNTYRTVLQLYYNGST